MYWKTNCNLDLKDGVGVAGDGDDPLGAGAVTDVDLGAALLPDVVDGLPALSDDRAHLLARGEAAEREVDTRHVARQLELGGHHWRPQRSLYDDIKD